ncbi:hypothetical protein [Chryseobacterium proteolyticum]|uniref:hypothetical protein n=1 Tax=Chryseobacterium proteolyticum TaxID=118127 RepID=UPI003982E12D
MELYLREEEIGLDFIIGSTQKKLYEKLCSKWGVSLDAYPRCYVLEDIDESGKRTVEYYKSNKEYSGNLIVSEKNKFFFTAEEDIERVNNIQFKTKVSLYFILDLKFIYPNISDRCDAKILNDVVKVLDSCPGFSKQTTIVTDYQNVFRDFYYEFDNIQPYYCFRIDCNTQPYVLDQIC